MSRRIALSELKLSEKIEQGRALSLAEIEYLENKPVLDATEAAWRLGISRRQLVKELHAKFVLRADRTVPGSNRLRWSKECIDRARKAWGHGELGAPSRKTGRGRR